MTLVRPPRRKATAYLATEALKVAGDFVEAGVFTGGTAIIMNAVLSCNGALGNAGSIGASGNGASERTLWLADSFEGLPDPAWNPGDSTAGGVKQEAWEHLSKKWTASQKQLFKNFGKVGAWWATVPGVAAGRLGAWASPLPPASLVSSSSAAMGSLIGGGGGGGGGGGPARVQVLAGWFKDTLPSAPIGAVSFLRCDADMYSSTLECLTYMYPKLSVGGLVYIDDYHEFEACRLKKG
jgi:hypothetical protein